MLVSVERPAGLRVVTTALIVVVAAVAGLALALFVDSRYWLDEALTVNIAGLALGDIPAALRRDGHPPLYYFVLHGWMTVFGSGDAAVRALSLLCVALTAPLLYLAGRRHGGPRAGVAAFVLFVLSPFTVRYGTEARMYALVMLLVAAGWLVLEDAVRLPSRGRLVALALITGALSLTHYWSLYLIAVVMVALIGRARHDRGARPVLVAMAVGILAFVPWLPSLVQQIAHTGTPWAAGTRPTQVMSDTMVDLGGTPPEGVVTGWLLAVAALLGVFGRAVDRSTIALEFDVQPVVRPMTFVTVATLVLGTAVAIVTQSAFASRYAAVVVPMVLVLCALGLTRFLSARLWMGGLALLVVASLIGSAQVAVMDRTQSAQWISAIERHGARGDTVVFCPDQLGPSGTRHLDNGFVALGYPSLRDARFVDWTDYEQRNAKADPTTIAADVMRRTPSDRSVWVVWAPGFRTFGSQCESFTVALAELRPTQQQVVEDNGTVFTEHGWLLRYPP